MPQPWMARTVIVQPGLRRQVGAEAPGDRVAEEHDARLGAGLAVGPVYRGRRLAGTRARGDGGQGDDRGRAGGAFGGIVATTTRAPVAPTTANVPSPAYTGLRRGSPRGHRRIRMGCSMSTNDAAETAKVAASRTASSRGPCRPVRSALRNWNSGQCHR